MGAIGDKIIVDGTVAYVAGENKILVPYDFRGDFSTCNSTAYGKNLKGCENPRLPTDETDDLPEEVAREIVSFYGDIGGFWTSIEADHTNIEIVGTEAESLHYAGIMGNYFSLGRDGVAHAVWGYCLDATNDTTTMGLLVLYDVIVDEFEFTDVEDTADPNYSNASNNICINDALLATFELTYGDLKAQYGEPTYSYWDGGGAYYTFDTRFGSVSYGFSEPSGDEPSYNTLPCALATTAGVLFNNFGDGKTVSAISTAVGTSLDIYYDEGEDCQTADFNYNGMTIYIYMDDSQELISNNAGVWVKNAKYNY